MITRTITLAAAVVAAGCATGPVRAQGSFDFATIPGIDTEPTVDINLNAAMLGFVTAAAGASGESEAADLLAGIEGIRVRVYEDIRDADAVVDFIDQASTALEREGWQRAVYVHDDGDRVHMYLRFSDDQARVAGMTVMIADDSDAVFMNLSGEIDPQTLGRVSRVMGLNGVVDAFSGGVLGAIPPALAVPPGGPAPAESTPADD